MLFPKPLILFYKGKSKKELMNEFIPIENGTQNGSLMNDTQNQNGHFEEGESILSRSFNEDSQAIKDQDSFSIYSNASKN